MVRVQSGAYSPSYLVVYVFHPLSLSLCFGFCLTDLVYVSLTLPRCLSLSLSLCCCLCVSGFVSVSQLWSLSLHIVSVSLLWSLSVHIVFVSLRDYIQTRVMKLGPKVVCDKTFLAVYWNMTLTLGQGHKLTLNIPKK